MAGDAANTPYLGVDAHLNSYLQQPEGGWRSFHILHLTDINRAINRLLPDSYYVISELSLQIATYDVQTDARVGRPTITTPDVTVYQRGPSGAGPSQTTEASVPILTLPLPLASLEEEIDSLIIYRLEEGRHPGRPVTRLELLSPANKPPGSHHSAYLTKWADTLRSGLRLVEIDYLHERRPVHADIPSYIDREDNAYPYYALVSDPRPTYSTGVTQVYGFGVDAPMPIIPIPLDGPDVILLNLGEVYRFTLDNEKAFRILADYSRDPVNMRTYREDDQARIRQRMDAIAATSG